MRSLRAATLALIAAGGAVATQDAGPAPAGRTPSRTVRLEETHDWLFALNGYTFTRLLRLKRDGTFEEYSREHMFVALSDAGRWRQSDDGDLLTCSHHRYQPIRAGALRVWTDHSDVADLPAVIQRRLANRDGTLEILKVGRLDGLTWLAPRGDAVEGRLLEEYRRHTSGAFVSAVTPVSVAGSTFAELLGSRQGFLFHPEMNEKIPREAELDDMRPARIDAPQCGPHEDLARPLPPDRE